MPTPLGRIVRFAAFALCIVIALAPARAEAKPSLDYQTQEFISNLAHKPELMNLDYLQHYIGRPANERSQRAMPDKQYYWYGPEGGLKYELMQSEHQREQTAESQFVMHLPNSTVTLDDVQHLYGKTARRFYEYGSNVTMLYSYVPNTQLVFVFPRATFRVGEVKINYRGPLLPAPSTDDMGVARDQFKTRMGDLVENGRWSEAVPWLLTRLKENPYDAEAHYQLGRAYSKQGHLHEAIIQYKAGLALSSPVSGGAPVPGAPAAQGSASGQPSANDDLQQRCIAGLRELRVVAVPEDQQQKDLEKRKKFQVVQRGQRIRTQGTEKVRKKKEAAAPQATGTGSEQTQPQVQPTQPVQPESQSPRELQPRPLPP